MLDTGARGSTVTFAAARAWATCCWPGKTRPIWRSTNSAPTISTSSIPPISILAEPPVAVVDANVDAKGTRKVAEAYLELPLFDGRPDDRRQEPLPPVQAGSGAADRRSPKLPEIKLVTIDDPLFGGWAKAQPNHFGDGGIFDQIYKPAQ